MNFFFGIKSSFIKSNLSIPKFQNYGKANGGLNVYEIFPENKKWKVAKVLCDEDKNFFFINNQIENNKNFFLAKEDEVIKFKEENINKLIKPSNFTDTSPAFRANLKINLLNGGYSSYQSEYPFDMTKKRGNILSPISILLDKDSDQNIIFFKNIFHEPVIEKSNLYFINYKTKKIVERIEIQSNYLNEIYIKKELINNEIYLFTESCLGIPLFVSIKNFQISFEHTHPPHHYILSEDRFNNINKLKNEFKKIINQ